MNFQKLVHATTKNVVFYRDSHNAEALFVEYENDLGAICFDRLDSLGFRSFLLMKSLEVTNEKQSLNPDKAIAYIRAFFSYNSSPQKVDIFIRTAGDLSQGIEYDLKDDDRRSVIVDQNGWVVTSNKKHKFLTPSTALEQVEPKQPQQGLLELLRPFVNLHGNDYLLFVIWLVQAFCSGNHNAVLLNAPKGSGKSTLARVVRALIEPCEVDITPLSKKIDDVVNILSNLYLVCYDNVRSISQEQSDTLCVAITGSTVTKRALFTNNDLCVQKLRNVVLINGISAIPKEADLAERFLVVTLDKIDGAKRKREKDFWDSFHKTLPYILGAIFDTLSSAMTYMQSLSLANMPRMADAFADMLCIAMALGLTEDEFRSMYDENVEKMNQLRSSSPLVNAVQEYMDGPMAGKRFAKDKAEPLFEAIRANYSGKKSDLPGSASHFTQALDKEFENLKNASLRANIDDTNAMGTTVTIIRRKK